jgi:hypothetical protein
MSSERIHDCVVVVVPEAEDWMMMRGDKENQYLKHGCIRTASEKGLINAYLFTMADFLDFWMQGALNSSRVVPPNYNTKFFFSLSSRAFFFLF